MTRRLLPALALALALAATPAHADAALVAQVHATWAIHDAALRWGVSEAYLDCLASHESGYTPWAVGSQGEIGVFQFKPATYYAWSPNALDSAKGPWNAWSNADVAAYMVSRGQSRQWTTTYFCGVY